MIVIEKDLKILNNFLTLVQNGINALDIQKLELLNLMINTQFMGGNK